MGRKWNIRIGTGTTPRKQSAIKAAREGRMLQRHWDYVKPIYLNALYTSLRIIMFQAITHRDVRQFVEECIEDVFVPMPAHLWREYRDYTDKYRKGYETSKDILLDIDHLEDVTNDVPCIQNQAQV